MPPETTLDNTPQTDAELIATLQRIGTALASEREIERIVQTVTDEATQLTGAEFGAFFYNQVNEKGESYTLYTLSGVTREAFAGFPMPRNTEVFAPTFHGDGTVRSDDITADPRYGKNAPYYGKPKGHLPVVSYLAISVKDRAGAVIGGLFFGHSERAKFTARHEQLVNGIAGWASLAMDNARLFAAERVATTAAREAQQRVEEIVERAPAAIRVFAGPDHVTVSQNAESRAIRGRSVVGLPVIETERDENSRYREVLDEIWQTGKPFVGVEVPVVDHEGRTRYYNMMYQPLRDAEGAVSGILSHGVDVSSQVLARAEVQAMSERAERALAEAEEANRVKSEFLARMSHDLRTPLNAIGGYTQLMELGIYGPLTEQQREGLKRIARAQDHLLTLINDILSFARLEAGQVSVNIEPVLVRSVFDELAELVRAEAVARGLSLGLEVADTTIAVLADRSRLVQVLTNLATNAIKFTDSGSVTLSATVAGDDVLIRVRDTGRGIPAERLESIWIPFVQVREQGEEDRGGAGLGLAISRELTRLMRGSLTAESAVGLGSTFTICLPRA